MSRFRQQLVDLLGHVPEEHRAAFEAEQARVLATGLLVLCGLAVTLFPSFVLLDYLQYPEKLPILAGIRAVATAMFLVLLLVANAQRERALVRHPYWFITVFTVIGLLALDAIIMVSGGIETPYYAGMNLLLLAISAALPQRLSRMAAVQILIVVQLDLVALAVEETHDWVLFTSANFFLVATLVIGLIVDITAYRLRAGEFLARLQIQAEKSRSDDLLLNILPEDVAAELKASGRVQARQISGCTILFTDFVGFTAMSSRVSATGLVESLDQAFRHFDDIITRHDLEKLKTIGDSYMCAGGVLDENPAHLVRCVLAGLEMLEALERGALRAPDGRRWRMRVGVHTGPVVAGVIGEKKFAYDLWGDTVNTASRMETTAQPSSINMATEVFATIEEFFLGEDRGFIPVRGKGPVAMTRLLRLRPQFSLDSEGYRPNAAFAARLATWPIERTGSFEAPTRAEAPAPALGQVDPLATFAMLLPDDREKLESVSDTVPVSEGQVLIEEGQDLSVLFLVVRGLFGVSMRRDGADIQVAVLGPGEILGELSFVSLEPASATVVALEESVVLRFDLRRMQVMHAEAPGMSARLFHSFALVLANRVRESSAKLFSGDTKRWRRETPDREGGPETPLEAAEEHLLVQLRDMAAPLSGARQGDTSRLEIGTLCSHIAELLATGSPALVHAALHDAYPVLMSSRLLRACARTGPTGHVAVELFLSRRCPSTDPVGRAVDRWLQATALAEGVRAGVRFCAERIARVAAEVEDTCRVAVFACGSGPELFAAFEGAEVPDSFRALCVDADIDALVMAAKLAEARDTRSRFTFLRADVQAPGALRGKLRMVKQHLVCLPRLAALMTDEDLVDLLDQIHAILAPGGLCLIGQLDLPAGERALLHSLVEHPVFSRSPQALVELAARSAFGPRAHEVQLAAPSAARFVELRHS